MATFNVYDKVKFTVSGKPNGVGVIADIVGTTAKVFFDKNDPKANTKSSFYTYADIKMLEHYRDLGEDK